MRIVPVPVHTNYDEYLFSHLILAYPDSSSDISRAYKKGFLPSSHLGLHITNPFYLARSIRINLKNFILSKTHKRELHSNEYASDLRTEIIKAKDVKHRSDLETKIKQISLDSADRIAPSKFTVERIEYLMNYSHLTHYALHYNSHNQLRAVGYIVQFDDSWHLWFNFYEPEEKCIGKLLLIKTLFLAKEASINNLYLGTCYGNNSKYKVLKGCEFFHFGKWSSDRRLLINLIENDTALSIASNIWGNLNEVDTH